MPYKDSQEEPQVGDKVLGEKVKGFVAEVRKDGQVVVRAKGPWNPQATTRNGQKPFGAPVETSCAPAELVLHSRAPVKPKK